MDAAQKKLEAFQEYAIANGDAFYASILAERAKGTDAEAGYVAQWRRCETVRDEKARVFLGLPDLRTENIRRLQAEALGRIG